MKLVKEDLLEIIEKEKVYPVFQPIVSLQTGEIKGYEALSRIEQGSVIRDPEELFRLSGVFGKTWEMEKICRRKILKQICNNDGNIGKLFLNVNPMVMHDKEFRDGVTRELLEKYNILPKQVVFEVTERSAAEDMREFQGTIRHYKRQGYEIAIDDVGSCYSGLNLICDIKPKYLKLDMKMIRNVDKDVMKYAMVRSMVEFSKLSSVKLIAEGIETEGELNVLIELGVHYGQGYFLKKPSTEIGTVEEQALTQIKHMEKKRRKQVMFPEEDVQVILFHVEDGKAWKGFRKKYGDEKLLEVLQEMDAIVRQHLQKNEYGRQIDSRTYLAIVRKERQSIVCESVYQSFARHMHDWYTEEENKHGYVKAMTKKGEQKKYPLLHVEAEVIA